MTHQTAHQQYIEEYGQRRGTVILAAVYVGLVLTLGGMVVGLVVVGEWIGRAWGL